MLPPNLRHHLCLAVKETLNNAIKHANATEVRLQVELLRRELSITVADNGIGLTGTNPPGDGLDNLETRLAEIDGTVVRASAAGGGTRIVLTVQVPII